MKNKHHYAACVSPLSACEQIVKTAACIAADDGSRLTIITVLPPYASAENIEFISYLQELSRDCSTDLAVLYSSTPAPAIMRYFKVNKITHAFIGSPADPFGFGQQLLNLSEKVMRRDLSIIQLPRLSDQQISSIDVIKASELSMLFAQKNQTIAK